MILQARPDRVAPVLTPTLMPLALLHAGTITNQTGHQRFVGIIRLVFSHKTYAQIRSLGASLADWLTRILQNKQAVIRRHHRGGLSSMG